MKFVYLILASCLVFISQAQILSITPSFPNKNTEVTITYDATQGSGGLIDVNPVYMHTGLITSTSTSDSDWKYVVGDWGTDDERLKLTSIGDNKHQKTFVIKDFYQIPDDEEILMLAFVFRNVDGSKEGKTADFSDIFIPASDGSDDFIIVRNSPEQNTFIVSEEETFNISIQSNKVSQYKLLDNGIELISGNGSDLLFNYEVKEAGDHVIEYIFISDSDTLKGQFTFTTPPVVQINDVPENMRSGITILNDTTVRFVLTAPGKEYVHLVGDFNNWSIGNSYAMDNSINGDLWWYDLSMSEVEFPFTMQYLVDGVTRVADPFSELVVDVSNDKYIPQDNFPDLHTVSENGPTNGYVSLIDPNRMEYKWTNLDFEKPASEKLIIYELLMRDFLETRSYETLLDTLDYLENLGINAIEFMPINEFEGNESWGYNPSFHMALDKAYGTPEMFKKFIDEAHSRGIAIILDVVYNHAFGQSPFAQLYWDSNGNKPAVDNPWLNPDAKHLYNVGYDFNHESQYTKDFVDQVTDYWLTEYNVDGFRFDLSKGFTQKQTSTDGAFAQYDPARVDILKRIASTIWSNHPDTYVILEHFASNAEEKILTDYGMLVWGNYNHSYREGAMGFNDSNKSNFSGMDHNLRDWNNKHLVSYMESHDEERMMYSLPNFGNSLGSYDTRIFDTSIERSELATHFFLTIPGPKMIWQFGELGYDHAINRCEDGSINNNCRLSNKPIEWDYIMNPTRKKLLDTYTLLNKLRKSHEIFNTNDYTLDVNGAIKQITLRSDSLNFVIIGNFDVKPTDVTINFPKEGLWFNFYNDNSINTDGTATATLKPGEFRMYFDKDLDADNVLLSQESPEIDKYDIVVYPNPASDYISINKNIGLELYEITIFNSQAANVGNYTSDLDEINIEHLLPGLYFLQISTNFGITSKTFLVH